ncbi:MAG: hypothetical protein ACJ8G4_22985 [Burkholderiales bacterium]
MPRTVTALVDKPIEAQYIIEELTARCLVDRSDISLIAQENSGHASRMLAGAAQAAGQVAGAVGAAAAAAGSAATGFASAVSHDVPGVGVLSVAGRLGGSLSATAFGTLEALAKAFIGIGIEQNLANRYADALRNGQILIVLDAKTDAMAQCARQVIAKQRVLTPASG